MTQNGGKSRDELAREANQVRTRLLRTVEQLDTRRHDLVDVKLQLKRHLRQVVAIGALALLATVGAAVLLARRVVTAGERRRRERWRAARRLWRHPDRFTERRSFLSSLVRGVLLSVLSAAVTIPARRAVGALLEPPKPAAR